MDESPKLRPILLVLAAMFAFSLMVVFTRGAQANILGVAAWRAIIVAIVFAISTVLREGGVSALKPDGVTLRLGLWLGLAWQWRPRPLSGAMPSPRSPTPSSCKPRAGDGLSARLLALQGALGCCSRHRRGHRALRCRDAVRVSLFQVSHFASSRFLLGDFLAFVSAIGYAAVLVLTRMTRRENTPSSPH